MQSCPTWVPASCLNRGSPTLTPSSLMRTPAGKGWILQLSLDLRTCREELSILVKSSFSAEGRQGQCTDVHSVMVLDRICTTGHVVQSTGSANCVWIHTHTHTADALFFLSRVWLSYCWGISKSHPVVWPSLICMSFLEGRLQLFSLVLFT